MSCDRPGPGTWEAARAGDGPARALVSQFALDQARRTLSARRVPRDLVDDLAQETVVSVLGHLDTGGETPREIAGFVKWRALGILSDQRRSARNQSMHTNQVDAPEPVSGARGPAAAARVAEVRAALEDCRNRLGRDARELLALRYEGACDAQAIATRLGVTRNAVHVRTFRALAALRECLERKGIDPEDVP